MDEDIKVKVGQKLLSLRKNKGSSQADVAQYLNITTAAYQNYEAGRREVNYINLTKLADYFNVTTDELLGRNSDNNPIHQLSADELEREVLNEYFQLPAEIRHVILESMKRAALKTVERDTAQTAIDGEVRETAPDSDKQD